MIERFAVVTLLVMIWAAGYDSGQRSAVEARHNHPACHTPLKP